MAKKSTMISLPGFEGVEEGGGSFHIPEGDYRMKCTSMGEALSKSSKAPMITFTFTGMEGKAKNKKFWLYCSLNDEALWKLRQTLRALNMETPDKPYEIDAEDAIDVEVVGTVTDNEYEGKTNSKLTEVAPLEVEEEPTTEKVAAKGKNGGNKLAKMTASEIEGLDDEELEDVVSKYGLDVDLSTQKTKRRRANAVIAAMQTERMLQA